MNETFSFNIRQYFTKRTTVSFNKIVRVFIYSGGCRGRTARID